MAAQVHRGSVLQSSHGCAPRRLHASGQHSCDGIARALRPGGLAVQWLPLTGSGVDSLAAILRTFSRLDPTFRPVTLYAEAGIFNFSYVRVERRGATVTLTADVRGAGGEVRFGSRLELVAEAPSKP